MVRFCQGLFAAAPIGSYHWVPDPDETEIFISDSGALRSEVVNQRPIITVTRSMIQAQSLGLDDMEHFDQKTGTKTKAVLMSGHLSLNCCAREELEADQIAWIVFEHIWLLRERLIKEGFFEIGRNIVILPPTGAEQIVRGDMGDEYQNTAITIPYQFPRLSKFTPLGNEIVQSIDANLTALRYLPEELGMRNALPHELPTRYDYPYPAGFAANALDRRVDPNLPKLPHPNNPAVLASVKRVRSDQPGLRPPRINGKTIPLASNNVEQSDGS